MLDRSASTDTRTTYVAFANAKLPDTDYRVSYAKYSKQSKVLLALPERPTALPTKQYIPFRMGEGFSSSTVRRLLSIPSVLRRSDADVAHFFATQLSLAGPILARFTRAESVMTITGLGRVFNEQSRTNSLLRPMYVLLFRAAVASSAKVLFQNSGDMEVLKQYAPRKHLHKIKLIGSAVDSSYFAQHPFYARPKPICIMIARVHPSKGVADFISIAQEHSNLAEFLLVGPRSSGRDADELLEQTKLASAEGSLKYLGKRSDSEVREILKSATVLVIPSRGEGIPRVALEAGLSGVAPTAYDIPGCRAVLPERAMAPSFRLDDLKRIVLKALTDEDFRQGIAQEVNTTAHTTYSEKAYTTAMDDIVAGIH